MEEAGRRRDWIVLPGPSSGGGSGLEGVGSECGEMVSALPEPTAVGSGDPNGLRAPGTGQRAGKAWAAGRGRGRDCSSVPALPAVDRLQERAPRPSFSP